MAKKTNDKPRRERRFSIRMNAHEKRLLAELAAGAGLTSAEFLRALIRREETLAKAKIAADSRARP